jgi:signal transduction histidine kinase/ActR/RegA family two-component response regulator
VTRLETEDMLAVVATRRVRSIAWVVLLGQLGAFALSVPSGVPLGTAAIIYNCIAIPVLGLIVLASLRGKLPPRLAPTAATIVWCVPVAGTLVSQYHNGQSGLVVIVLIELACLAMLVDTRLAIGAVLVVLAGYLPLVIRDAQPVAMHVSAVLTGALFGITLQMITRRSLVDAEMHRLATAESAAELARRLAELERIEDERTRLNERLLHAQRLEAVGTLAAGIAHDMNNVLAAITSYANVLAADDPSIANDVQPVVEQAFRGAELTRGLLAFSRRGQYRKAAVALTQLVDEAVPLVQPTLANGCTLVIAHGTSNARIVGDPVQLRQVIVNLCLNAGDAMAEGGVVVVATDRIVLDDEGATEYGIAPGAYVRIHVADNGSGIDDATRRRMFEPFFTTKPAGKGTGLGLALVWGVVQAHDGTVHVESEPGRGSRFTVFLPEAVVAVSTRTPRVTVQTLPTTILVVDDEVAVRNGTTRLLKRRGYTILTAGDGAEALRVFDAHAGEIGLVILDMGMPVMGGAECFAKLRERSDIPVLIATGYAMDAELQEIVGRGAALIEKPFESRTLLFEVSRLMARSGQIPTSFRDGRSDRTPT